MWWQIWTTERDLKIPQYIWLLMCWHLFILFFIIFLIKHACRLGEQRPVRSAELDKDFCIKSCFLDCTWKGGSNMGKRVIFFLYCDIWIYLHKKTVKKKKWLLLHSWWTLGNIVCMWYKHEWSMCKLVQIHRNHCVYLSSCPLLFTPRNGE